MGADLALVDGDGALGDGEAEADAAGVAVAVGFDAEEGFEEIGEAVFGDAGAVVADGDDGVVGLLAEGDVDRCVFGGETDGVAEDVFDGAAEEFAVAAEFE